MGKYIFQRIIALVLTLFIIVSIAFLVIRLMPGTIYEDPDLPQSVLEALNAKYHFDKPLITQYYYFVKGVILEWDWGTSIKMQPSVPVFDLIKSRVPITLKLNLYSLFISLPIGITLGIIAAIKKNSFIDYLVSFLVVVFISVPSFIYASLLQYFIAYKLDILPIIYNAASTASGAQLLSMALPILALSFGPIARVTRYLRAELAETMNSEFLLLARTKGLTYTQSIIRHGIRNSFIPLVNIIVPMVTNIMGGSLVVERIFAIPGMGGLMVNSINASDHSVTIAILLFYSLISLITMLIIDITYGIVDPRVRIGGVK